MRSPRYLVGYQLHFFSVVLSVFVLFHRPHQPLPLLPEHLSNICLLLNRSIFIPYFAPSNPNKNSFSMITNLVDISITCGLIWLVYAKRRACTTLSRRALSNLLFQTLPATVVSVTLSLTFLFAETSGCLMRRVGNSAECNDVVYSGTVFAFTFLCAGIVRLTVLPFHPNDYDLEHVVKFNFRFREQLQLILFSIASLGALYTYSSAQEIDDLAAWEEPDSFAMGSAPVRTAIYATIVLALVVLMTSIAGRDHDKESSANAWTARMHARMKTKSFVELAPALRAILVVTMAFLSIPTIILFVLTLQSSGHVEVKTKLYLVAITTQPAYFAVAVFYFMSRVRERKLLENPMIIYGVCTSTSLVFSAYKLSQPFFGTAIFCFLLTVGFKFLNKCRTFLAMHSDDSIALHLQTCVEAACTVLGPSVYLMGETLGCMSLKSAKECELTTAANFCVNCHICFHLIFTLLCSYTFQRISWTDMCTFRNCDFTTYFRLNITGFLTVVSFFIFGMRPKDSTATLTDADSQYLLLNVVSVMKYVIAFLWLFMFTFFYGPIAVGKVIERAHLEQDWDDHDASRVVSCWQSFEKRCKKWFDKLVVPHERLAVSPSHSSSVLLIALTPCLMSLFYYATAWSDMTFNTVVWLTGNSLLPATCMYMTVYGYCFIDVEDSLAIKTTFYLPSIYTIMSLLCCIVKGDSVVLSSFYLVVFTLCSTGLLAERKRAVKKIDAKFRRRHLYGVVTVIGASELPPCIFMASEYIACLLRAYVMHKRDGGRFSAFSADGEEGGTVCEELMTGILPIMIMIVAGGVSKVVDVHYEGKDVLTLKKIMTLKIPADIRGQLAMGVALSCWAILNFGMRKEGYKTSRGAMNHLLFLLGNVVMVFLPIMIRVGRKGCVCVGLSKALDDQDMFAHSDEESSEEEEEVKGAEGAKLSKSLSRSQSSASKSFEDRMEEAQSVGGTKSIWEGGTRGSSKSVEYKQYMSSLHGIKAKREDEHMGAMKKKTASGEDDLDFEDDEFDFGGINPGLL